MTAPDNSSTIIGAVVGSLGGLLVIGGIVTCVVVRKKKRKTEELETPLATREKETAPKSPTSANADTCDSS